MWGKLKEYKGGENHKEALSERGRYLPVIQLPDTHKVAFGEVQSYFLPCLPHGCGVIRFKHAWRARCNIPVYRPPSSPSSVLPPGNATCASCVLLTRVLRRPESVCVAGSSRCKNKISGLDPESFTQSSSKNSESVGGGCDREGMGEPQSGDAHTRRTMATLARRGSTSRSLSRYENATKVSSRTCRGRFDDSGWGGPYTVQGTRQERNYWGWLFCWTDTYGSSCQV